jgi:hypothetical protein
MGGSLLACSAYSRPSAGKKRYSGAAVALRFRPQSRDEADNVGPLQRGYSLQQQGILRFLLPICARWAKIGNILEEPEIARVEGGLDAISQP